MRPHLHRAGPLAAALALLLAARSFGSEPAIEWIVERGGTLELKLAHVEKGGPDGGVLRIDPNRRVVLWEGISGDLGCKLKVEASFDEVKTVRVGPDKGFSLELRRNKAPRLVFMPLPDAPWLNVGPKVKMLSSGLVVASQMGQLSGPDGDSLSFGGSAAFSGPRTESVELPPEVTADLRVAVTRIRETLGRTPSPAGVLREAIYGRPVDASLQDLIESPASYDGRSVRVRGLLQAVHGREGEYRLVDESDALTVHPLEDVAPIVRADMRADANPEVEIAGVFRRQPGTGPGEAATTDLTFWEYYGPGAAPVREAEPTRSMSLDELAASAGAADGQLVRVVGSFRGRNLYKDLPEGASRSAWVIKAGRHAAWVTGRKPSGPGFKLDPDARETTQRWLEVVGRPETKDGVTLLHATSVALTAAPAAARALHGVRLRGVGGSPVVVFSLPLEGERVALDSRFVIQFSTYMDDDSFEGRVRLRYADSGAEAGEFPRMSWRYDDTRRALIVDPGEPLQQGRHLELLLLPGILDSDGTPLAPRPGRAADGPVEILPYEVGG